MGLDQFLSFAEGEGTEYKWRKFNAFHNWITKNRNINYINQDDILDLQEILKRVIENPSIACDIFPTLQGFFFGSIEYNINYFNDCSEMIKDIDLIIEDKRWDIEGNFMIYASSY